MGKKQLRTWGAIPARQKGGHLPSGNKGGKEGYLTVTREKQKVSSCLFKITGRGHWYTEKACEIGGARMGMFKNDAGTHRLLKKTQMRECKSIVERTCKTTASNRSLSERVKNFSREYARGKKKERKRGILALPMGWTQEKTKLRRKWNVHKKAQGGITGVKVD